MEALTIFVCGFVSGGVSLAVAQATWTIVQVQVLDQRKEP